MTVLKYKLEGLGRRVAFYETSTCVNCGSNVRRAQGFERWSHYGLIERCDLPDGGDVTGISCSREPVEEYETAPPPDKAKGLATDEELTQLQSKLTVDRLLSDFDTPETPNHYSGDLVMRVIEERGLDFALGNVVKYVSRAGTKPGESKLRDLKKAQWYLTRVIDREENN